MVAGLLLGGLSVLLGRDSPWPFKAVGPVLPSALPAHFRVLSFLGRSQAWVRLDLRLLSSVTVAAVVARAVATDGWAILTAPVKPGIIAILLRLKSSQARSFVL